MKADNLENYDDTINDNYKTNYATDQTIALETFSRGLYFAGETGVIYSSCH